MEVIKAHLDKSGFLKKKKTPHKKKRLLWRYLENKSSQTSVARFYLLLRNTTGRKADFGL